MVQGTGPIHPRAIDFRQRKAAGRSPRLIPRCLVESRVGIVVTVEVTPAKAEMVVGFTVVRIGVPPSQSLGRSAETFFRLGKLAATKMPQAHRVVATGIQRVAAQRLAPIRR